jgi:hypothetical protein
MYHIFISISMNFQQALCHVETRSAHSLAGCGSDRSTVLIRLPQASCAPREAVRLFDVRRSHHLPRPIFGRSPAAARL